MATSRSVNTQQKRQRVRVEKSQLKSKKRLDKNNEVINKLKLELNK